MTTNFFNMLWPTNGRPVGYVSTWLKGDPMARCWHSSEFEHSRSPVWRSIPVREMAKALGVSLQSLANWCVRNDGPEPEVPKRGKGNRTFYRPDKVLVWLDGGQRELWEYSRDWLLNRGLDVVGGLDRDSTAWMIEGLDDLL